MVKCLRGLKWLRESERERASERGRVFVFEFVCVRARALAQLHMRMHVSLSYCILCTRACIMCRPSFELSFRLAEFEMLRHNVQAKHFKCSAKRKVPCKNLST